MITAFQPNAFQQDAFQVNAVTGTINTIDALDTASFSGLVVPAGAIVGTIATTDALDTASFVGSVTSAIVIDTHDGFTAEEIRRAREIEKKLAKARLKLFEAQKAQKAARKQKIRDIITPPVAQKQQIKVESQNSLKDEALAQVIKASAAVKRLEIQQEELQKAIALKVEQVRIQTELAILKAKELAELDDEEALLLLL